MLFIKRKKQKRDGTKFVKRVFFNQGYKKIKLRMQRLTEEQSIIATNQKIGNVLVVACPGSGKTTTMAERIAFMIRVLHCKIEDFFISTFSKKAAAHFRRTMSRKCSEVDLSNMACGTFHALSRRILFEYRKLTDKDVFHVDELQYLFEKFLREKESEEFKRRIKYVFVDEFQDINDVQHDILKHFIPYAHFTVVGDDDQNIYSFRGSDVKYMYSFPTIFPSCQVYNLSINFRSTRAIVDFANASIHHNRHLTNFPKPQSKSGLQEDGPKPVVRHFFCAFTAATRVVVDIHQLISIHKIDPGKICVLARTSYILYYVQSQLYEHGILSNVYSGDERFSENEDEEDAGAQQRQRQQEMQHRVVLSTIHASKGLEWEHVYVLGLHNHSFPDYRSGDLESERRIFYVAITRCQFRLVLCNSQTVPSQFVTEIGSSHVQFFNRPTHLLPTSSTVTENPYLIPDRVRLIGIVKLIRALNGGDYLQLKQDIFPSNFASQLVSSSSSSSSIDSKDSTTTTTTTPIPTTMMTEDQENKSWIYEPFLTTFHLEKEFGIFLDCLGRRMISEMNNVPIHDKFADECFSVGGSRQHHVPSELLSEYQRAYTSFKDLTQSWKLILHDIFLVSHCYSFVKGKSSIIHAKITLEQLQRYQEMYQEMERNLFLFCHNQSVEMAHSVSLDCPKHKLKLLGEIDLLINRQIIIDLKNTLFQSHKCNLEHFLQVLTYASVTKQLDYPIRRVIIYNVIANRIFHFDLSSWSKQDQLCTFMFDKIIHHPFL